MSRLFCLDFVSDIVNIYFIWGDEIGLIIEASELIL